MATAKTIVSYNSIVKPFPDRQTLLSKAREQAGKVFADPAKADRLVSQLSDGLDDLQIVIFLHHLRIIHLVSCFLRLL